VTPDTPQPPALPVYGDDYLARLGERELIDILRRDGDRAPRNLIDACAARGDAMVQALRQRLDRVWFADEDEAEFDDEDGAWWLPLHAAMIAGLVPTEAAGRLLLDILRRLEEVDDVDQDWLVGYWPVLFANKPGLFAESLRELAEDPEHDFLTRVNAAEAALRLALQQGPEALEAALDWMASLAADEEEERYLRLCLCHSLLDFPRVRHRPLIDEFVARQPEKGRDFTAQEVDEAFDAGRDQPEWERFLDPWRFYAPAEIEERQRRWKEEDREDAERRALDARYDDFQEPYIRLEPKVGRNDPCPCGSGKKYKKCCSGKEQEIWT
jgi:hypothetical protein